MGGQRAISEAFHGARNFHASHLMTFQFESGPQPAPVAPHYTFNKDLKFSVAFFSDVDVKALQNILKWEGLFPSNVDSTGYYGAVTAKSVLAWQKKHAVALTSELDALQGKVVGPKTRAKLNSIYGL